MKIDIIRDIKMLNEEDIIPYYYKWALGLTSNFFKIVVKNTDLYEVSDYFQESNVYDEIENCLIDIEFIYYFEWYRLNKCNAGIKIEVVSVKTITPVYIANGVMTTKKESIYKLEVFIKSLIKHNPLFKDCFDWKFVNNNAECISKINYESNSKNSLHTEYYTSYIKEERYVD